MHRARLLAAFLLLTPALGLVSPASAEGAEAAPEYPLAVEITPEWLFPAVGETLRFTVTLANPTRTAYETIIEPAPGRGNAGVVSPGSVDVLVPAHGTITKAFQLAAPTSPSPEWAQLFVIAHDRRTGEKLGYDEAKVIVASLRLAFDPPAVALAPGEHQEVELVLHNGNDEDFATNLQLPSEPVPGFKIEGREDTREVWVPAHGSRTVPVRVSVASDVAGPTRAPLTVSAHSPTTGSVYGSTWFVVEVPETPASSLSTVEPTPAATEPEEPIRDVRPATVDTEEAQPVLPSATPPPATEEPAEGEPASPVPAEATGTRSAAGPPAPRSLDWATVTAAAEVSWTALRQNGAATVTVTTAGLVGALGAAMRFRENLRWGALAPFLGLFTRLKRPDVLKHPARARIHELILAEPGMNLSRLKRETGLNTTALVHHLRTLERHRLVTSRREGRLRCFYAVGARLPPVGPSPLPEAQARILSFLREGPLEQQAIAERLGLTRQGANYHVKILQRQGLLHMENRDGRWVCVATDAHPSSAPRAAQT